MACLRDTNLLILDVDEALVFGTDPTGEIPDPPPPRIDFWTSGGVFPVMKRPGVDEFLRACFSSTLWRNAIWSTSGKNHVRDVIDNLLLPQERRELEFVFTNKQCTRILLDPEDEGWTPSGERFIDLKVFKKLRRRGYDLNRVLMIDDSPRVLCKNYGNLVRIKPFTGDTSDRELLRVLPFLEKWFQDPRGVRSIEKRGW